MLESQLDLKSRVAPSPPWSPLNRHRRGLRRSPTTAATTILMGPRRMAAAASHIPAANIIIGPRGAAAAAAAAAGGGGRPPSPPPPSRGRRHRRRRRHHRRAARSSRRNDPRQRPTTLAASTIAGPNVSPARGGFRATSAVVGPPVATTFACRAACRRSRRSQPPVVDALELLICRSSHAPRM